MAVDLLVADVDNTLYDWVAFYIPSFIAMMDEICRISGVSSAALAKSFQSLHRKYKTTEYSFAIEELDVLAEIEQDLSPAERLEKYATAVRAFKDRRGETLKLYPGVAETLSKLRRAGILLVAHSDTIMFPLEQRLRALEIDTYFDAIFVSKDPGIPPYLTIDVARTSSASKEPPRTRVVELPAGVRKPDPDALLPILKEFGIPPERAIYVGDSISRDVVMAQRCDVPAVLARYGQRHSPELVKVLHSISFWSEAEIQREEMLKLEARKGKLVAEIDSFSDIENIIANSG